MIKLVEISGLNIRFTGLGRGWLRARSEFVATTPPCPSPRKRQGYRIWPYHVLGLIVRDAPQAALPTMRV
jgi:hypothetical protein